MGLIQEHVANEDTWLTTGDVARILHVSPKTVARWASEGKVPHIITLGGHRRFPSSAVNDLASRFRSA